MDRECDISQPLEKLHPDETMKKGSNFLRGTISDSLRDPVTGAVADSDAKLMKFHGIYRQDDRDLRDERRRQKLEPAHQFMVRVRIPGGVVSPTQWLQLDEIGRTYGNGTLRLTTRQTIQFHGVLKRSLPGTIQALDKALLDTIAACGDDSRGVMCSVNPHLSALHREVYSLAKRSSDHLIPRSRAYREIWFGETKVAPKPSEEPVYGPTYLPRKFKVGFVLPPVNDIDVYTQDIGLIAIADGERLEGFNICVGGGMGRTDKAPHTYPRLADVIGFVPADKVMLVPEQVMGIQRDYGNRADRTQARFKYTIDRLGLDWFRAELERRLGFALEESRPYHFDTNSDRYGWQSGSDGLSHAMLFVENGRLDNTKERGFLDALREIARIHTGEFRITPNQNILIANVHEDTRAAIMDKLTAFGIADALSPPTLRGHAMACVALPTCGLAMAESERYMPSLIRKIEALAEKAGLAGEPITIRMTGCPNGCARPYVAEIAFTGRAPGKYNMYLGGGFHGQRLNRLHRENIDEEHILEELGRVLPYYARERQTGERLGDFLIRVGYIRPVTNGRDFNS